MHLPSVQDLIQMIKNEECDCYLYCCDVARAYQQRHLDPVDWPLMCIKADSRYYMDASLLVSLMWAATCCQNITGLIVRDLVGKGLKVLSYIDNFSRVADSEQYAQQPFDLLHDTLACLGLQEAVHKACSPACIMTWLRLQFNTSDMSVTIPEDKLEDILSLVHQWRFKQCANIHKLRTLLGKLFHMVQCCPPACYFVNRMLSTLRECLL